MKTLTHAEPGLSQRDELERLQEDLREVRRQREELPRENAELASQVEQLEQEVRELRRAVKVALDEAEPPLSSLPEQLVTPFRAIASRRTAYGRVRFALRSFTKLMLFYLFFPRIADIHNRFAAVVIMHLVGFGMLLALQGPDDDEDGPAWRFDDEGFSPLGSELLSGKVRYQEIQQVEVKSGWIQRLFGFGFVRVTWRPAAGSTLGKPLDYPNRFVDIDLLDDPKRLAEWLEARARQAGERKEEARVG